MKILNTQVYGLKESLVRSGYPMMTEMITEGLRTPTIQDVERSVRLGHAKPNSGHDCFLKGILVQADFIAPQYFWQQAKRYTWFNIISSQSTMHKINVIDIRKFCDETVTEEQIAITQKYINLFNKEQTIESFKRMVSHIPSGFMLGVGITTNYLQLKTMKLQRKNHKLDEWNETFDKWCESLPMFKDLVL